MSFVRIDWNPDRAALRRLGVTLFAGFAVIGAAVWFLGGSFARTRDLGFFVWGPLPWFLVLPAAVLALALLVPEAARPLYKAWMGIAFVLGTVVSTVLLAAIYWVLFSAVGGALRLFGRDPMRRRPRGSLWVPHPDAPPPERYLRQY